MCTLTIRSGLRLRPSPRCWSEVFGRYVEILKRLDADERAEAKRPLPGGPTGGKGRRGILGLGFEQPLDGSDQRRIP